MRRYQKVVDAGVEMLDKKRPTWRKRIDSDTLDMSSIYSCMLGQLYEVYFKGLDSMEKRFPKLYENSSWPDNYGFNLPDAAMPDKESHNNFKLLTKEWISRL